MLLFSFLNTRDVKITSTKLFKIHFHLTSLENQPFPFSIKTNHILDKKIKLLVAVVVFPLLGLFQN